MMQSRAAALDVAPDGAPVAAGVARPIGRGRGGFGVLGLRVERL
jgi:hypothetical protein